MVDGMLQLIFLLFFLGAVRGSTLTSVVGDTYSCFSNFVKTEMDSCSNKVELVNGAYELTAMTHSTTDFCVSGPVYGASKQGTYEKAKNYVVSADLQSSFIEKYSNRYGFVGLAFNMMDTKNYDIAYVRPHTQSACWETGHVEEGVFFGKNSGKCDVKLASEFNLAVKVENGKATLYLNGVVKSEFNSFFPSNNRVGTALRNKMEAKMIAKDLSVCYELDCVSSENGRTVITKPGQEYKTGDMGPCEACSCQLYGQLKCGCKSAKDQGVTCSGNMIAAVAADCCARCVPPSARCYASGDPHYRTFDGRSYDFMGRCTYCFAKTNDFEIRQKNKPYSSVSVTAYSQLLFEGDTYTMVDGRSITLKSKDGTSRSATVPWKKFYKSNEYVECLSTTKCALYLDGVMAVSVESAALWIDVQIHGQYYERTTCLCGKWDGNPSNDFTDKNGKITSANAFAHSWQRDNTDCPLPPDPKDPCDDRAKKNYAEQYCARFKQVPFKQCPLDVTQYYADCQYDICLDPNDDSGICANAKSYADACAAAGYPVDGWRTKTFCPMKCQETFIFDSCGGDCWPTCDNPNPDCSQSCNEGCYCPTGMVLQAGRCVDDSECKCTFEGDLKETGEIWLLNATCQTCECLAGGIVECNPRTCDACPAGQIPVPVTGECCPACHADWANSLIKNLTCNEGKGPVVFTCQLKNGVLVRPEQITWTDGAGQAMTSDNLPDGFSFDSSGLVLTLNPCEMVNMGKYKAEVMYKGVKGTCDFTLNVIEKPDVTYIELIGDSPKVVKEGDCVTMSVKVVAKDINFAASDFTWKFGPAEKAVDSSDGDITLSNGGKTVKICNAEEEDEGKYTVCASHNNIEHCVDIELKVLVVCELDDGSEITEGENKTIGCATCVCDVDGVALCTCDKQDLVCDDGFERYYDENCCAQCSRLPAVCSVTGDPHYKTFDGHRHDFQGDCKFTMVSTSDFKVNVRNEHRGGNTDVSWTKEVEIIYKGVTLLLGPDGTVTNGQQALQLPYQREWRSGQSLSVKKAGEKVIVSIKLTSTMEALYLEWDGNSTSTATIHGKYYDGTSGLCGTWNENAKDDQTKKNGVVDDNVGQFGYSWKIEENGELCKSAPQPPHPCDDTLFPDAAPIGDATCNILNSEPFATCHAVVDITTALYNCKYDVCSCYDQDCGCAAIKQYVQSCLDADVKAVEKWRQTADFCPLTCDPASGKTYYSCGSNCPATCADRKPDCGRGANKCNEGCFCPVGTYEQNGTCVTVDQCRCLYDGQFKQEGETWYNDGTCKDCQCRPEGEVTCVARKCKKCKQTELPVRDDPSDCCRTCIPNWIKAKVPLMDQLVVGSKVVVECETVESTNSVIWEFSNDNGLTWTKLDSTQWKGLKLTIDSVAETDAGQYKCIARMSYRTGAAITTVTVAKPISKCTVTAPVNGAAIPVGDVDIGATVQYSCNGGYYLEGAKTVSCKGDGSLSTNVAPVCKKIEKVQVTAKLKIRGSSVTLNCKVPDAEFGKGSMSFYVVNGDTLVKVTGTVKFVAKTKNYSIVAKNIKATTVFRCLGYSKTNSKVATADMTATTKGL